GKTTISGMIVDYLTKKKLTPILAVDADPNSNLNEVLGVDIVITLGDIREKMQNKDSAESKAPANITRQEYADFMFNDALVEENDFDMLVMGRTQGAGCYCYVNSILKTQIEKYRGSYRYIVVDSEAGFEHISRGIMPYIDILLLISDASRRGIQTAGRVAAIARDLKLQPKLTKLIVNRAPAGVLDTGIYGEIDKQKLELTGIVPQDETVYRYDVDGKPSSQVPAYSAVKIAIKEIMDKLLAG
ncbi:MAG TPA: AAA family ATPase, partial [Acidobacteriota bacterium]|nr:AAA family ATPase [Acidobacteriota bacterium]